MLNVLTCVYLALLLLRPQEFLAGLRGVPLLQLLTLATTGLWFFGARKDLSLPHFPLLCWLATACLLSAGAAGWWAQGVYHLTILLPIFLLFAVLTSAARELAHLRRIMVVMIVAACVMVLHGRWQVADGVGWTGLSPMLGRITYIGIFGDPNDLGQLFVMCMAFCLYLLVGASRVTGALLVATIGWLGYGIYMTDSRGTLLAALAVFGFEALRRLGKIAAGVLGTGAAAVLIATTRLAEVSSGEQSAGERVEAWYAGTQMLMHHPVFGVGMGNFTEYHYLTAHNFLVLPMAELGVFGFIPWFGLLWFCGLMLRWLAWAPHIPKDSVATTPDVVKAERDAALALVSASIGFVASSFFLSQSYKHVLFIVIGLIVARFSHAATLYSDAPKLSVIQGAPRLATVSCAVMFLMWMTMKVLI